LTRLESSDKVHSLDGARSCPVKLKRRKRKLLKEVDRLLKVGKIEALDTKFSKLLKVKCLERTKNGYEESCEEC